MVITECHFVGIMVVAICSRNHHHHYYYQKKEEKKEKDKDKPRIPEIKEPKFDESPITGPTDQHPDNKKHSQPNPTLWYPEYKFGGQNLLRLTDTEKIQEMKDWTLYDLVIPILDADSENLLANQNQIKEKLRF